ncbi:MAG: zinc ribbon domain-containing protein, partial [Dermatophilaceae bacterium]|nr:zinc ribbon domain-containing protein [Dermatophilaceae bacterium]
MTDTPTTGSPQPEATAPAAPAPAAPAPAEPAASRTCHVCGTANPAESSFCEACGADLVVLTAASALPGTAGAPGATASDGTLLASATPQTAP